MPRQIYAAHHDPTTSHSYSQAQLAPSPLYSQQRMTLPPDYFTMPATTAAPSAMPLAPQPQEPAHEPYAATNVVAPAISLPASHRPSSGAWSPEDDQQLIKARAQGLNWGQIKAKHFQSKTPNACRKRHERLTERRNADDWDNRKLQTLAKEYMNMRKEIWTPLAHRVGEKWTVVEQKCMSNGIKNLQSAARAASRYNRMREQQQGGANGGGLSGYDDDSGVSGIGLTPGDELDASYSSPEAGSSASGGHSGSSTNGSFHHHPPSHHQHHHHHHPHHQQHHSVQHLPTNAQLHALGSGGHYAPMSSPYALGGSSAYHGQHHHQQQQQQQQHHRYSSSPEQQHLHLLPAVTERGYGHRRHR